MRKNRKEWKKIAKHLEEHTKELETIIDDLEVECLDLKSKYNKIIETEGYNSDFLNENLSLNKKIAFLIKQTDDQMKQSPYSKELGLTNWLQNRTNYLITYLRILRTGGTDLQKYTIEKIDKANEERKKALQEKAALETKYNKLVAEVKSYQEMNGKINSLTTVG